MKCFTISVTGNIGVRVVKFKKDEVNAVWKEVIGTDLLDRQTIAIGGETYLVIVDDIGKLKKNPITSVIWKNPYNNRFETLVGNVVIHRIGQNGQLVGLTSWDIQNIKDHIESDGGLEYLAAY